MEKSTDVQHVAETVNTGSTANEVAAIDTHLKENLDPSHSTLSEIWPVVRPALSFLESRFTRNSPWANAIGQLVAIADVELSEYDNSQEVADAGMSPKKKNSRKK